jgi:hypothetical protein
MDMAQVSVLRGLLLGSEWLDRTDDFAGAMRSATRRADGLLLFGTPDNEPWHLAAHLSDEAELSGATDLRPTLVRWSPPLNAPPHLSITLERLREMRRGEPLLVVADEPVGDTMLERVNDARHRGGRVFALTDDDRELEQLAHESLTLSAGLPDLVDLAVAEHLVSMSAAAADTSLTGWRASLRRTLDRICGS